MEMLPGGGKESSLGEDDHISRFPDDVLGEIVSHLSTKEGGRTQVLSSRWRHLWRCAPLILDLDERPPIQGEIEIPLGKISGILSSHTGTGRRFSVPSHCFSSDDDPEATMDGWLRSPALDGLRELEFHYCLRFPPVGKPPQLADAPASTHRFSSTLRVASFGGCDFPDGTLLLPHLKQLSLMNVAISGSSLFALLAGCPVLQSLMLTQSIGCPRIRIVSRSLRSIGVQKSSIIGVQKSWGETMLKQIVIEDAPYLERLLLFGRLFDTETVISVISAPKLEILGQLPLRNIRLEFGAVFQGSRFLNSTMVVPNVKVLALAHMNLRLDVIIEFMKCFPCLEKLYIKLTTVCTQSQVTNAWRLKYRDLIDTLDIRLKKIVATAYQGNKGHVNFAKFFVLNAGFLESMVLEVDVSNYHEATWIERQRTLLQIENRASKSARLDFVTGFGCPSTPEYIWSDKVHDLSTADPFVEFDRWTCSPSM